MYLRFVKATIKTDRATEFEHAYAERVKPELERTHGCLFAGLMRSGDDPVEAISMTVWDTRHDADRYEKSGIYKSLLDEVRPYILDADEWKMRLRDPDLFEEEVKAEPEVSAFPIQTGDPDALPDIGDSAEHYLRIVSLHVKPGEVYRMIRFYEEEIVPRLLEVDGCRTAFLVRDHSNSDHVLSITLWDARESAIAYETGGLFHELLEQVQPMLAHTSEWRMALDTGGAGKPKGDKVDVSGWQVVMSDEFATISSAR
jgi:heme-degrading monooxygenase HmoA